MIIQRRKVDDKIPITLVENFKKTSKAIEPRTPISAIVIVGVNVIKKKTNITDNKASYNKISTLKTWSKIKNWMEKTRYLNTEYKNVTNKSLKLNNEMTLIYCLKKLKKLNFHKKLIKWAILKYAKTKKIFKRKRTSNENLEISIIKYWSSKNCSCKIKKANDPKIIVVNSWAILHKIVIKTAWILSLFSKQKTLPPYSPILFGVNEETVMPEKIALKDVKKEIASILRIINFHFNDSNIQFINIIKTTIKIKL